MDWTAFIKFLETHPNSAVILPILKQSKIESFTDTECIVEVENSGAKFFLDSKRAIIEEILFEFSQKNPVVVFTVAQKKERLTKKKKEQAQSELSLLQFQGKQEEKIRQSGLQPRYTFENFAVSTSNHMAYAASQAVSKNPATQYNPLFIYGDVGVGKTHLSHAIAHVILKSDFRKRVLYCTSEQFTNDLVDAIRTKRTQMVRDKYRLIDVLIVDDIQFIAGKNSVQEEFYHTFNAIVQQGGQIILTSDRAPKEIKALEDRLRSRFSGGLIIDMQKQDFELRTAIVLIKAQERNIDIDMKAAQNIAEKITDSRELEGALLKLLSLSLTNTDTNKITAESAHDELEKEAEIFKSKVRPNDVIRAVATYYELKPSHIRSSTRKQNIAMARQIAMYMLRVKLGLNLDECAFILKRKDHTTVLHGVNKVKSMLMRDRGFKDEVESIYQNITAH
jgi:chromosomal replication initiator protein